MEADDDRLPPRLGLLGETMRPLARKIALQLDAVVMPELATDGMNEFVARQLQTLTVCVQRIAERAEALMPEVIANDDANAGDVYRAAGRFEAQLDLLLDAHRAVRAVGAAGRDAETRDLLAGVYRHTLTEIEDWLDELVEALTDPERILRRRGLPMSGDVEIAVTLNLTSAPELAMLSRHIGEEANDVAEQKPRRGFWKTVATWLVAWGLVDALCGDGDRASDDA